jgi:hypothetical protein
MSLWIDVDDVRAVLLADGQWYEVAEKAGIAEFDLDSYEFHANGHALFNGGTGFWFITTAKSRIEGPMSSIVAVRTTIEGEAT